MSQNQISGNGSSSAAESTPHRQSVPRWNRFFYLLAGFNLFTVILSIWVSWRLAKSYSDSIEKTAVWTKRISHIVVLGKDVSDIMTELNKSVLNDRMSAGRSHVNALPNKFQTDAEAIQADIAHNLQPADSAILTEKLGALIDAANALRSRCEDIYNHLETTKASGESLAELGKYYAAFNDAHIKLRNSAREMQAGEFDDELAVNNMIQRLQFGMSALVLLVVIATTLYGLRMAQRAQQELQGRLKAEEESLKAKQSAEAANSAKSDFLANMSHELRTPLNGVIGMSELLLNSKLTGRQQDYALTVRRSAESLLTILNDILDLSKIEAGKLSFECIPFDLQNVVEEVGVLMSARASEKNLELILRYSPDAPRMFEGDPLRIRQVLSNIVGNAVKFTAHGHVLIEAMCVSRSSEGRAQLVLRVEDTGIGITKEEETRLFKKFSQCDSSMTRRFGGTGLGLAICKNIVELMGGSITVASTPGKGSIFTITLSLSEVPSAEVPTGHRAAAELQDLHFLIVDDNEVNRMVLCEQLTGWKIRHTAVASGRDALKALENAASMDDPFDMAILDFQMPEMDGEMLATAIKSNPAIRRTALIMLSSMGYHFSSERMKVAGLEAMLHKPTRQSALLDTISNVWAVYSGSRTAKRSNSSGLSAKTAAPACLKGLRVLLAEDNEVNREVALGMLEALGCTIDVATDGQECVNKFAHGEFDAILMDCQMPVMDGYEATSEIRRVAQVRGIDVRIPIVAMTANAMKGDREHCLLRGMDEYVSKPIRLDTLSEVLAKVSARSSPAAASKTEAPAATRPSSLRPAVDMIGALETAGGKSERLKRIFKAFLNDISKRLAALDQALTRGDMTVAEREAHSIKGAAANISAGNLRGSAFEIERMCKAGEVKQAMSMLPALAKDAEAVVRELSIHVEEEASAKQLCRN